MKTVSCPSCSFANAGADGASRCAQCGEPLAAAFIRQSVDEMKRLSDKLAEASAPSFSSFNGFGTTLLDYRELPDGTYEATRWVIAMCLPIYPLSTYVIQPTKQEASYGRETSKFVILGKHPLSAARVLRTYLLAVIGLLPVILGFMNSGAINRALRGPMAAGLMFLCIGWAIYIIFFKLKNEGRAYKSKAASYGRQGEQESGTNSGERT